MKAIPTTSIVFNEKNSIAPKQLTGSMVDRGNESGSSGNAKGKEKGANHGYYLFLYSNVMMTINVFLGCLHLVSF
jgi:hypothetical protein